MSKVKLDLTDHAAGVYFVQLSNGATGKTIKVVKN
jgi:hypothetical protein